MERNANRKKKNDVEGKILFKAVRGNQRQKVYITSNNQNISELFCSTSTSPANHVPLLFVRNQGTLADSPANTLINNLMTGSNLTCRQLTSQNYNPVPKPCLMKRWLKKTAAR